MQFGSAILNSLIFGASLASALCVETVQSASAYSINDSLDRFQKDEAKSATGFSTTWAEGKVNGHVGFQVTGNKVQYQLKIQNGAAAHYKIALAIFNKGEIANWVAVPSVAGGTISGCAEGDVAVLNNPDISYGVELIL